MIIGICGKSGSGKSTLANILTKNKTTIHIDVDKIGHEIYELEEVKKLMLKEFGNNIYKENKIDRASLGKIVFKSKKQMEKLTQITWPSMEKKIDNIINQTNTDIIIDWLLLPKTKFFKMCDTKILLDIPYDIRKRRCLKRDNSWKVQTKRTSKH